MDADAFNAFEAAGWQSQAAGYDDFFGRITTRVIEPLLDAAGSARARACWTWPPGRAMWRPARPGAEQWWWGSTSPRR